MRSTQMIVDLKSIKENIINIRKYVGNNVEIMPVVKANGYGTHLNYCPDILNEFNYVAVALLDEAIILRKNGYLNDIFILYPLSKDEIEIAIQENFIVNGSNIFEIKDTFEKPIRVHVEIETGMGRVGVQEKNINEYIRKLNNNPNVLVDGIFTHLSSSKNKEFSLKQINQFEEVVKVFSDHNINPKYKHICCSGGLVNYKDYIYNMIRVGLLIYGYYPNESIKGKIDLKPSMCLKTNISFLKKVDVGDTIGYNRNFVAKRKSLIATIPFGFADGLIGMETGLPCVIIRGQLAKIVGICMDNMMIDVTDIAEVKIGDEVYIWDNDKITIDEVGEWCNGICNYEVMASISERVPRILKR